MELNTDYWTITFADGGVVSLLGLLIYLAGLALLTWAPLVRKQYATASLFFVVYTAVWFALGIWWTAS